MDRLEFCTAIIQMKTTLLIADDDPVQRRLLEAASIRLGHRVVLAENGDEALAALDGPEGGAISLILLDLVMPGRDGMTVLKEMQDRNYRVPVIVQTSKGSIDAVVMAMRAGATDFVVKPVSPERLKVSIQNALRVSAMEEAVQTMRKSSTGTFAFDDMIAESPAMASILKFGERAASSNIPVLLEGESGVGKEVMAKAIQGSGDRRGKPFVAVNCGALPETLAESILFGHEKGAFTGASQAHAGKFKEADGGTLFLDEIGELPMDIQVKLLRAIQEGEIDPVGGGKPVKTDFRLITATNRDLAEEVKAGNFREDLFYRINVFPISLPPLRERREDIAPLIRHFTARICLEEGRRKLGGIRGDALDMLESFDWPGNIRQLENTLFRAIILCDGDELTIEEFPQIASVMGREIPSSAAPLVPIDPATGLLAGEPQASPMMSAHTFVDENGQLRSLEAIERDAIVNAIDFHNGRMTRIARDLGIGRSTLYRRLKDLGIEGDDETEEAAVS